MEAMSLQVALVSAASKCGEPTGPCAFSDRWADFYANYVAPACDVTVPALCVFFAILVLARLVPVVMPLPRECVGTWDRTPYPEEPSTTTLGFVPYWEARAWDELQEEDDPAHWARRRWGLRPHFRTIRRATRARRLDPDAWVDLTVWPRWGRRLGVGTGVVLALASAVTFVLWIPDIDGWRWLVIFLALVAGLAGALLMGLWLGSRLRLTIDATGVDGTKSATTASHVAARIGDLGGSSPHGLEMPRGTDTSAMVGSVLADVPESKLAQVAIRIVQGVLGSSPWRAMVDEFDADTVSVVVTRNGRQASSAVVDRKVLVTADLEAADPAASEIDLHRFAAAAIIITLARFRPREFAGLCGASEWRSLGLTYLASTRYQSMHNRAAQRLVLARAVDIDPHNWLAQIGLRSAKERLSTSSDVLAEYRCWLRKLLAPGGVMRLPGFESLRLRALHTALSLSINARFVASSSDSATASLDPDTPSPWVSDSLEDGLELMRAIDQVDPRGANSRLALDLAVTAVPLARTVHEHVSALTAEALDRAGSREAITEKVGRLGDYLTHFEGVHVDSARRPWGRIHRRPVPRADDDAISYGTKGLYNAGCYWASRPPGPPSPDDVTKAMRNLRLAVTDPRFRDWATSDPQLTALRRTSAFWSDDPNEGLGLGARTDFLGLEPIAPFTARLRAAALTTPREIAAIPLRTLVDQTGARVAEATAIRELARLRDSMPSELDALAVEILHELVADGCASRGALERLRDTSAGASLVGRVDTALRGRADVPGDLTASLARWTQLAPPAPTPGETPGA